MEEKHYEESNGNHITFDEEKTAALKLYLEQKGTSIEREVTKSLETLFTKSVPAGVREFIALRSGNGSESSAGKEKRSRENQKNLRLVIQ